MFSCWRVVSIIISEQEERRLVELGKTEWTEKQTEFHTKKCPSSERTWISKMHLSETQRLLNRKSNDGLLTPTHASGHGREEPVLNTQPRTFLYFPAPCSEAPLHEGSAASQTVPIVTGSTSSQTVPPVTDWVFKEMFMMDISHSTHTRRA